MVEQLTPALPQRGGSGWASFERDHRRRSTNPIVSTKVRPISTMAQPMAVNSAASVGPVWGRLDPPPALDSVPFPVSSAPAPASPSSAGGVDEDGVDEDGVAAVDRGTVDEGAVVDGATADVDVTAKSSLLSELQPLTKKRASTAGMNKNRRCRQLDSEVLRSPATTSVVPKHSVAVFEPNNSGHHLYPTGTLTYGRARTTSAARRHGWRLDRPMSLGRHTPTELGSPRGRDLGP